MCYLCIFFVTKNIYRNDLLFAPRYSYFREASSNVLFLLALVNASLPWICTVCDQDKDIGELDERAAVIFRITSLFINLKFFQKTFQFMFVACFDCLRQYRMSNVLGRLIRVTHQEMTGSVELGKLNNIDKFVTEV